MNDYRIANSPRVNERFKKLCVKARSERRMVRALFAIKELTAKLQTDPHSVGELLFRLKSVGFPVHHASARPWSIHFAIDDERKIVNISEISLLD
jgi:hypothetical protein